VLAAVATTANAYLCPHHSNLNFNINFNLNLNQRRSP
jgi:hypothetical protein